MTAIPRATALAWLIWISHSKSDRRINWWLYIDCINFDNLLYHSQRLQWSLLRHLKSGHTMSQFLNLFSMLFSNHSWLPILWRQPLLLLLHYLPLLSSYSLTDCNSFASTKSPSPTVSSPFSQHLVPGRYTSAHGCQQGRTSTPLTREPAKPAKPPPCQRNYTPYPIPPTLMITRARM